MATKQASVYHEGAPRNIDLYHIAVDDDAIRHVFARYGDLARETARGQIPVRPEDFGLLPETLQFPDSFEWSDARSVQSRLLRLTKLIDARR